MTRPIKNPPAGLRQRPNAKGDWSIWWEPDPTARKAGFRNVTLDAEKPTWSVRKARDLNEQVGAVRANQSNSSRAGSRARSISALIAAYKASPHWAGLRPATQADYHTAFRNIEGKWGSDPVLGFTKSAMHDWWEALYHTLGPWQAASLMRKMSVLFSHAELKGWIGQNPCLRLKIRTPHGRSRTGTWEELDALTHAAVALHRPSIAAAIMMAALVGQRQSDILAANWSDFREGHWIFTRAKRGNPGGLEIPPELASWLGQLPRSDGQTHVLICESTGQPWQASHFQHQWARVRAAAARDIASVASLKFLDLRRTFGHFARLGGADTREVADALGNTAYKDPKLSQTYMPANAISAGRAINAIQRPEKKEKLA